MSNALSVVCIDQEVAKRSPQEIWNRVWMERNDAQQEFVTFSDKQVMMSEKLTLRVVVSSRNFTSCSGHHLVGIFSCSVQEEGFV